MRYRTIFIYFFVSVLPVCMALSGLSNLTPWIDEVMFVDTPMRYVRGAGWTTHSWYSIANQEPFMLYPPLYLCLPFSECCDNPVHWMGVNKNSSAVIPENCNYPDPSAYNIIMVYKRYGFYV